MSEEFDGLYLGLDAFRMGWTLVWQWCKEGGWTIRWFMVPRAKVYYMWLYYPFGDWYSGFVFWEFTIYMDRCSRVWWIMYLLSCTSSLRRLECNNAILGTTSPSSCLMATRDMTLCTPRQPHAWVELTPVTASPPLRPLGSHRRTPRTSPDLASCSGTHFHTRYSHLRQKRNARHNDGP